MEEGLNFLLLLLYMRVDAYVKLEGLNKYENLRIVGHKYHKVFQGGWETYKKSLKEVKEYDRILITPLIQSKSSSDLGRTIFFIPAGMKPLENNLHGLKYVRSYYQNDMIRFPFSPDGLMICKENWKESIIK